MQNDEDDSFQNNLPLYLFFLVSLILVLVDGVGLFHVVLQWQQSGQYSEIVFEECLKWQLISKSCFSTFSLLTALSSLTICVFLLANTKFFVDKVLPTYLYYNYITFGPVLLGLSILGLANWDNIVNVCKLDKDNIQDKVFSFNNTFTIFLCFVISITITLLVTIYKTVTLYVDSLTQGQEGLGMLRKLIYWVALRTSSPSDILRRYQNNQISERNEQADQRNERNIILTSGN